MTKDEALKLALEALEVLLKEPIAHKAADKAEYLLLQAAPAIREALTDSALDRMAENARELGLGYEPPCKTGSQCTSKCQLCYDDPANIKGDA